MRKSISTLLVFSTCLTLIGCSSIFSNPPNSSQAIPSRPAATELAPTPLPAGLMLGTPPLNPTSTETTDQSPTITQVSSSVATTTTASLVPIASNRTAPSPDAWKNLPVIPTVSAHAVSIYLRGRQMGRDPHAFSKVGDCQSITTYFLAELEDPGLTKLGPYTSLQGTIDWYHGSFNRESLSVKGGFNAAAVLSPLRSDPKSCTSGESPVACEFRQHNPSIALISLEEWWAGHPENYEKYLRQIIEYSISQGVLPVVATKADNLEGNNLINQTIARLAWEYDIPLWNFWAAVQPLSRHGLIEDGFHLTHGNNFNFSVGPAFQTGWTIRNLTALQVLDAVRRSVASQGN